MRKILITLLLLITIIPVALALPEWYEISKDYYVKPDTIKFGGNSVKAWFKILNKGKIANKNVWYSLEYMEFSCNNDRLTTEYVVYYDLNNKQMGQSEPYETERIVPGTVGWVLHKNMCYLLQRHNEDEQNKVDDNY